MSQVATRKMTFEEFIALPEGDVRYELVDGELVPLMSPTIRHGSAQSRLSHLLWEYLGDDFEGVLGTEIDFPTLSHFGRRGDIVYLAPESYTREDRERGYPTHAPDLVIEVVSAGDENRDTQTKRREYALVGVPNYWIVDPERRTVRVLVLGEDGEYHSERTLGIRDELSTPLFPGLRIPLRRIFPGA